MRTILIFGPAGCGKTHNAERLRQHFGCTGVIDPWWNEFLYGYLHLTNAPPQHHFLIRGVEYISFADAMKEIENADRNLPNHSPDEH